jgi:hypothetical protein
LNAASCASPTSSKTNPTSQITVPATTSGSTVASRTIAASTGSDTTSITPACGR